MANGNRKGYFEIKNRGRFQNGFCPRALQGIQFWENVSFAIRRRTAQPVLFFGQPPLTPLVVGNRSQ